VLRSPSNEVKKSLSEAEQTRARWESDVALFSAQREQWQVEFAALAERCDESLERAESKRRRVAAQASRNAPNGQTQEQEMSREQIIELARRRTLGVT
jgi:adenine-specific DNA methylase